MKRSIVIREFSETLLAGSGLIQAGKENYSGALNIILDRYFDICRKSRPHLSLGEWEALKEAMGWEADDVPQVPFLEDPRRLPLVFEDFLGSREADIQRRKHPYDGKALLDKLRQMTYAELVSTIQALEAEAEYMTRWVSSRMKEGDYSRISLYPLWAHVVGWEYCGMDPDTWDGLDNADRVRVLADHERIKEIKKEGRVETAADSLARISALEKEEADYPKPG